MGLRNILVLHNSYESLRHDLPLNDPPPSPHPHVFFSHLGKNLVFIAICMPVYLPLISFCTAPVIGCQ
jgi:hypothetical protein